MTLFTITDHDTIDGCLEIAHLPNTFISEEITTYFPEDRTKVHVIAIDINEKQHEDIQHLRENIYELVDYMQQNSILHILAHPLYDMDGKLDGKHIEKFLLLFDNWEIINGTRSKLSAELTAKIAQHYTKEDIEILANKYGFMKRKRDFIAFTGGSDDHGGIDVGTTYTQCEGFTVEDLKSSLLSGFISAQGQYGDPRRLSHMVINITKEGLKNKVNLGNFELVLENLFDGKVKHNSILDSVFGKNQVLGFINNVLNMEKTDTTENHDRIFTFFKNLFPYFLKNSLTKRPSLENISSLIEKGTISIIPTLIYISVYSQRAREKHKSVQLYRQLIDDFKFENKKVAYFTDTMLEINGVAITTNKLLLKLVADMYMKFFYSISDRVLVPSYEYKQKLKLMGIQENKLELFRRGVNLNRFNPSYRDRNFWKMFDPYYNGQSVILYVGRVAKEKDIDTFIEVAKLFLDRKDVKFAIVGDGPYKPDILNRLPENIILTGFLRDELLSKAYASADIFLFPSTTETFGNVILEALASGLVCLVPDKGASKEFIVDDVNGYVIKDNNIIDYKIKIDQLLNNQGYLNKMKKNTLTFVKNYEEEELLLEMINKIKLQEEMMEVKVS